MKSRILKLIFCILLVLPAWAQRPLEKVSVQLDWLHQFQFAGYYMAKEKGFYKERGLDVHIKEFNFDVNLLQSVLNKESTYAVGKSSLILDKINGAKIMALAAIYQHSPMVLLTRQDSLIQTPKELYKKKVMLTPDARTAVAINSMIVSQGVQLEDVNFEPHSFKLDDLINGKTDAMGCYLSNEPFILKQKGIAFNVLDPRDYGFDFYGGLLFTSEDEVQNNTTRTHNFYMATMKGWEYAFKNIHETAWTIFKHYNTQEKSIDALIFEGETLKKLSEFDEGNLGKISYKKYSEILKIYSLLGYKHNKLALDEFIIEKDEILLNNKEKAYLSNNPITFKESFQFPVNKNLPTTVQDEIKKLLEKKLNYQFANQGQTSIEIFQPTNPALMQLKKSDAILKFDIGLVTSNNQSYLGNLKQLENKKIAISKNSPILSFIKKLSPKTDFTITHSLKDSLKMVENGAVFATVDLLPSLIYYFHENALPNLKIAGTLKEQFPIYLVQNGNETLQSILDKTIDKITAEERAAIHQYYLNLTPKEKSDLYLILKFLIPLIVIVIIILISNKRLSKEIKHRLHIENQLQMISDTDILTSVYNRQKSISILQDAIAVSRRYERDLSIIFFDIDNFNKINDQYGHAVADKVLVELTDLIKEHIRSADSFGRWDGEEFIIILPETNLKEAEATAQNLKNLIYNYDFENLESFLSCSFGMAQYRNKQSIDGLIKDATNSLMDKTNVIKVGV